MKLVAFTGAGISKQSGIPTFDEMDGIRNKLTRDYFNNNPEDFFYVLKEFSEMSLRAKPNKAHIALAENNVDIVTMNIDGLHRRAGSNSIVEVHGNLETVSCITCGVKYPFDVIYESIYCPKCKELLQPNVVLYGDTISMYFNAINAIGQADTLLVIGTSFYTSTANDFVNRAKAAGITVEIINENAKENVPFFLNEFFCS